MGQLEKTLNKVIQTTTIKTAKHLTFTLAQEVYWIDCLKLKEILNTVNTISVPRTSGFVKGVIDSRGKLISFDDNEAFQVFNLRIYKIDTKFKKTGNDF